MKVKMTHFVKERKRKRERERGACKGHGSVKVPQEPSECDTFALRHSWTVAATHKNLPLWPINTPGTTDP
ncbi:hypothetical protein E2C01_078369 [Portunus trituberculatus]|uniref:Uncharacterized protein n=1 Tax=Portunus trituberculatus TaxID=210409 RepID=A0A5B7ITZ0_PORTR|nr:hypothetical protein [Portunus trituberculatus]